MPAFVGYHTTDVYFSRPLARMRTLYTTLADVHLSRPPARMQTIYATGMFLPDHDPPPPPPPDPSPSLTETDADTWWRSGRAVYACWLNAQQVFVVVRGQAAALEALVLEPTRVVSRRMLFGSSPRAAPLATGEAVVVVRRVDQRLAYTRVEVSGAVRDLQGLDGAPEAALGELGVCELAGRVGLLYARPGSGGPELVYRDWRALERDWSTAAPVPAAVSEARDASLADRLVTHLVAAVSAAS